MDKPEAKENDGDVLDELAKSRTSDVARGAGEDTAQGDEVEESVTIESLQAQLEQANERILRGQAELENFRKRARRDMEEHRQYAILPLVADLLPAFDNLDRAVEAAEQNENATGLLEGVKMVASHIHSVLQQYNCRRVASIGSEFDPNIHEAIAQEPSEQIPAGCITRELRVGYQLHDRVIRPSQVMVSTGPPQHPTNQS
ncbi:MAG: nucleotide exchange factor GrpE [Pirellulaceae bacterium]